MKKAQKIKKKLCFILITWSLIFFICEIIIRWTFPLPPPPAYRFDPDYLVTLKANVQKEYTRNRKNGGQTIIWKSNSKGFRGRELRKNTFRIIVYGDSNIHARFSKLENTFPYKLETYLKTKTRDIEVINAGIVGFGPDQSLIRFIKEVDIYKPQMVIFHIFADNDFGDNIRNRLFKLNDQGELLTTGFKTTEDAELRRDKIRTIALIRHLWARTNDPDLGELRACKVYIPQQYAIYKQLKPRKFSLFDDCYDIDIALEPQSESAQVKIKLMEAILRKAYKFATTKKVKFLLVIQPSIVDLTTNYEFDYKKLSKYPQYRQKNLTSAVANIATKNNIPALNLFSIFLQNQPQNLFFKSGNNHWNDAGQDLAAQKTAECIEKFIR